MSRSGDQYLGRVIVAAGSGGPVTSDAANLALVRDAVASLLTSDYRPPPRVQPTHSLAPFWSAFDFQEVLLEDGTRLKVIFSSRNGPAESYAFTVELEKSLEHWQKLVGVVAPEDLNRSFAADVVWQMAIRLSNADLPLPAKAGDRTEIAAHGDVFFAAPDLTGTTTQKGQRDG